MDGAYLTKWSRPRFVVPLVILMAQASLLHAAENSYLATTTLFGDLTHSEYETDKETRAGAGVRGDIGANLSSGAHSLMGRYGATLKTQESSSGAGEDEDFSLRGASRYNYYQPGSRFDINAGHTIRSVRNDTGFRLDDANYDSQNAVSAGGGVNFYPGDLTTFRVGGQGGRTWQEGDRPDGESYSADATLSRQVSQQSSIFLSASRAWEKEDDTDEVIVDSASLGMRSVLHNGTFRTSVGISRAESDDFESEAVIGSVARTWSTALTSTGISYDRTQSSNLLDLTVAPVPEVGIADQFPEFDFYDEEVSIRYQGVIVRDQLSLSHSTQRFCDLCTINVKAQAAKEENVALDDNTWKYLAGAGVRLTVSDVKTLSFNYRWQGDAFEDRGTIDDEVHRFIVTYRHELTELATWGTSFDTSMTRGLSDDERYRLRVFVTFGWDGMNQ